MATPPPAMGQIVHYSLTEHRELPAVVVEVVSGPGRAPTCTLHVLGFAGAAIRHGVKYDAARREGTWHYPRECAP